MPLIRTDNNIPAQASLKRFALIYLPVVIALSIFLLSSIRLEEQSRTERIEGREKSRIEIASGLVTRDLSAVDTDLRVIANLPLLRWYLDSGNPAQRDELEKLFLVLAREARRYDQVRYLDASGQEVIRINYNDGNPAIVPREQLQNKLGRYYFDDTFKLNPGEIFVSPLDLNIEHDRLEIPHKPMIRFGTPVFDSAGRKKGLILLNYLGNELLQHFRENMQGGDPHSGMLLNRDGYWLSGARREDEWGFMLGKSERTFGHDFTEEWRAISAAERGALLTDQGLFVYTTVYPLLPGQRSATGSALANAPSQQELTAHKYQWKIVSFVPHAVLSGAVFHNQTSVRILLVIVYLLLALAAWIVARITLSREQAEGALRESENRYRSLVENSPLCIHEIDMGGRIVSMNRACVLMMGAMDESAVHGQLYLDVVSTADRGRIGSLLTKAYAGEASHFEFKSSKLPEQILKSCFVPIKNKEGSVEKLMGVTEDITERKQTEGVIHNLAFHDSLTQLPNRRLLNDRLGQAMAASKRSGRYGAVIFLDLDNFKPLNDAHGHDVGDLLLIKVAYRIVGCVRETDTVARFGGDEFVVMLGELDVDKAESAAQIRIVAEKIRATLAEPYALKIRQEGKTETTIEHHCTASIGVVLFLNHEASPEDILKWADMAMYQAKEDGRNNVQFYRPAMRESGG